MPPRAKAAPAPTAPVEAEQRPAAAGGAEPGRADHIALLRAVNVGGLTLKMDRLRALAAGLGWQAVRTHIASGNLLFRATGAEAAQAAALEAALRAETGVEVPCLVLTAAGLRDRVATCPFTPAEGKLVHGLMLFGPITIDEVRVAELRAPGEELVACPGVVWMHAPDGFGRSKLAERLDRVVRGAPFTARNLNTLRALVGLVGGGEATGAD